MDHWRLIPAHAGKTDTRRPGPRSRGAHPRSRGENVHEVRVLTSDGGSSPLTRGKPAWQCIPSPHLGLIPAHAGKTKAPYRSGRGPPAHPRSRGENPGLVASRRANEGSSPLTRGKHAMREQYVRRQRLIPAHAGKTTAQISSPPTRKAHPRSRGENLAAVGDAIAALGSSPLTRGKLLAGTLGNLRVRLIPAHAGKTRM